MCIENDNRDRGKVMSTYKTIKNIQNLEIVEVDHGQGLRSMAVMEGTYTHYDITMKDDMPDEYAIWKCTDAARKELAAQRNLI